MDIDALHDNITKDIQEKIPLHYQKMWDVTQAPLDNMHNILHALHIIFVPQDPTKGTVGPTLVDLDTLQHEMENNIRHTLPEKYQEMWKDSSTYYIDNLHKILHSVHILFITTYEEDEEKTYQILTKKQDRQKINVDQKMMRTKENHIILRRMEKKTRAGDRKRKRQRPKMDSEEDDGDNKHINKKRTKSS